MPPMLLANARMSDLLAAGMRRVLDGLGIDGLRWTRTDYVFGGMVVALALFSTGFFTTAYSIVSNDPTYFSRRLIASMSDASVDPITTGSVAAAAAAGGAPSMDGALPVERVVRARPLTPQDFEIVMVFGDEAWLATAEELLRVRVGSVVEGLGRILSIDAVAGILTSDDATLRVAPRP